MVPSEDYLLPSWLDTINRVPMSFPMLRDGKMSAQKNWNKATMKTICVEVLKEAVPSIPRFSRFLHIHLAKFVEERPSAEQPSTEQPSTEQQGDEKGDDQKEEAAPPSSTSSPSSSSLSIEYWPPQHHLRVIYSEQFDANESPLDRVTYRGLSQFLSAKYQIKEDEVAIAMFKVAKSEWVLLDDHCDDANKLGVVGQPFNIKMQARDGQIFAVFDLAKCKAVDVEGDKRKLIEDTISNWTPPPMSPRALALSARSNGMGAASRLAAAAAAIAGGKRWEPQQLTIKDID